MKEKDIVIVAQYTSVPGESGNSRFEYISQLLTSRNIKHEFITSSFNHGLKRHRSLEIKTYNSETHTFINEPGYSKNVSFKRLYSHSRLAIDLKKYLTLRSVPDIIYCAVPSLSLAKEAAKYAKKNNIQFIIDIQDLWPEAFKMVFNVPVISNLIYKPFQLKANYIYKSADKIIAVSETYLNRALKANTESIYNKVIYLGTDLDVFEKLFDSKTNSNTKKFIEIAYIGTLGHSYNIELIIDAISLMSSEVKEKVKFIVMGFGPFYERFKNYAESKNIHHEFTGRLEYQEMARRLVNADIAVNPIHDNSAGSIINKVADYAAAGLPVINTQQSEEYQKLVTDYDIGYNCSNESAEEIAKIIEKLFINPEIMYEKGLNNRNLAIDKFDRKTKYKTILNLLNY